MKIWLLAVFSLLSLGACGGPTEIAGISDEGGCGPFDVEFVYQQLVQVIRNDCPFEVTFRFVFQQDGCKLTLFDAGPDGEDVDGVVNSQGFYGFEFKDDGMIYDCQGDAVEDADRGTSLLNCPFDADDFCRIEFDSI
ncbi:MAG TPA: hypothetical protein VJR29_07350 [bacterium]|nr:hypothetical protein [bacterium]